MTSEWTFDKHEVLTDSKTGQWWHVLHRRECVDCGERRYELADATHTEYKTLNADDVEGYRTIEGMFESDGWHTNTKPAAKEGFRVNGVLCGPSAVEFWKGNDCLHEYTCPCCGADGKGEIDIIHSYSGGQTTHTDLECRECGHNWVPTEDD